MRVRVRVRVDLHRELVLRGVPRHGRVLLMLLLRVLLVLVLVLMGGGD